MLLAKDTFVVGSECGDVSVLELWGSAGRPAVIVSYKESWGSVAA